MKIKKGQGIIGEIIVWAMVIVISVSLLFLTTELNQNNPVNEENIQASLNTDFVNLQDQSFLTYLLHHELDREITAGQIHDLHIFNDVVESDSEAETICENNCDEENLGGDLPEEFWLSNSAQSLEDKVEDFDESDPRKKQYNQFANPDHPDYEPDIRWYGEHSAYNDSRKGGCNFNINEEETYKESQYEDGQVCTDYIVKKDVNYNITIYEAIKLYFDGNKFKLNDTEYQKDNVKQEISSYLETISEKAEDAESSKRIINISSGNEKIEFESEGLTGAEEGLNIRNWDNYTREIPTSSNDVEVKLWVGRP